MKHVIGSTVALKGHARLAKGLQTSDRHSKTKADPKAGPLIVPQRVSLEFMNIGHTENPWVDLGFADIDAVQLDVAFDVHPTHVHPHRVVRAEAIVDAGVNGDAERVVQIKRVAGQGTRGGVACEGRVVHTEADKRLERRVVGEVVLQRQGRRQMLHLANYPAIASDFVFERVSGQQLDADVVEDEVFAGQCEAGAISNINRNRAAGKHTVAAFRYDPGKTNTDGEIALRLREDWRCKTGKSGRQHKRSDTCHSLSHRVLMRGILRRRCAKLFDMGQLAGVSLRCGKNVATVNPPPITREHGHCI